MAVEEKPQKNNKKTTKQPIYRDGSWWVDKKSFKSDIKAYEYIAGETK